MFSVIKIKTIYEFIVINSQNSVLSCMNIFIIIIRNQNQKWDVINHKRD